MKKKRKRMNKRHEQTFLGKDYTDEKQAHEKVLNTSLSIKETQNHMTSWHHFLLIKKAEGKQYDKYWLEGEKTVSVLVGIWNVPML